MTEQENSFDASAIKKAGRLRAIDFVTKSFELEGISLTEETNQLLSMWVNREISTEELLRITENKR